MNKYYIKKCIVKQLYKKLDNLPKLDVLILGNQEYFSEFINDFKDYFESMGIDCTVSEKSNTLDKFNLLIIVNPLVQFKNLKFKKNIISVCIQTESINTEFELGLWSFLRRFNKKNIASILQRFNIIYDTSRGNKEFYIRHNLVHKHLNYGFSKFYDANNNSSLQKEFDLIFLGTPDGVNNRRGNLLDLLKSKYHVYPEHYKIWGKEKLEALQKSKICLNIHYDYGRAYGSPRFFESLSAGTLLLTEPVRDSFPFIEGEDYIIFLNKDDLIRKIDFYLANNDITSKIQSNGYSKAKFFKRESSFNLIISDVQNEIYKRTISNKFLAFIHFIRKLTITLNKIIPKRKHI